MLTINEQPILEAVGMRHVTLFDIEAETKLSPRLLISTLGNLVRRKVLAKEIRGKLPVYFVEIKKPRPAPPPRKPKHETETGPKWVKQEKRQSGLILDLLKANPDGYSIDEISEILEMKLSSARPAVSELDRQGLIVIIRDPKDQRKRLYRAAI